MKPYTTIPTNNVCINLLIWFGIKKFLGYHRILWVGTRKDLIGDSLFNACRVDKQNVEMPVSSKEYSDVTTSNMDHQDKLDPSDPRVKKLVYSMYRDMLTNYHENASDFINKKHPSQVTQDLGIGSILHSIAL